MIVPFYTGPRFRPADDQRAGFLTDSFNPSAGGQSFEHPDVCGPDPNRRREARSVRMQAEAVQPLRGGRQFQIPKLPLASRRRFDRPQLPGAIVRVAPEPCHVAARCDDRSQRVRRRRDYEVLPGHDLFPTVADFLAQFVDAANHDYTLVEGSPYWTAGQGGTRLGADQSALPRR